MNTATDDFLCVRCGVDDMRSQIINALLFLQFTDPTRGNNG